MPVAPASLTASPLDAQAALSWANPSDAAITGYSVRSATSAALLASSTWQVIAGSASTTVAHTVSSLANGARYYFQVRAANANGDSPPSNTASIRLAASPSAAVAIPDGNLRTALEAALGKAAGATITQLDMAKWGAFYWKIRDISVLIGLEHAVNLKWLDLSGNSISDMSPLAGLAALTKLYLPGNSISDVSPLAGLAALTKLYLSGNSISDVSPLGSLAALTSLHLYGNSISDVSPLGSLAALTWLRLGGNSISDVSPLGSLAALTRLDLSGNSISDVSPLGSLAALTTLLLTGNSISDATPLGSSTSLEYLDLQDNSITVAPSLVGLAALTSLNLARNSISDVSPLGSSTALTSLNLQDNSITDVSSLGSSTSLTYLSLYGNLISDVSPLLSNAGLSSGDSVQLRLNPLSAASVNTHIPVLVGRGVRVFFDPLPTRPPAAPRFVGGSARNAGESEVTMRWRDPDDATIVRYELRHAVGQAPAASAFGAWSAIAGSSRRSTEHVVSIPDVGWHTFELRAVNSFGNGPAARF